MEKLVENKGRYFPIIRGYKKNQHIQNTEKHINKKIANDFESWKKQAKEKIIKLKHGELTEDEVYEWLQENK